MRRTTSSAFTCRNLYRSFDFSWKLSCSSSFCRLSTNAWQLRKFLIMQWGKGWQSNSRSPAQTNKQKNGDGDVYEPSTTWVCFYALVMRRGIKNNNSNNNKYRYPFALPEWQSAPVKPPWFVDPPWL